MKISFDGVKISGISGAVPANEEVLMDRYVDIVGEEQLNKFIKKTGVKHRFLASDRQTSADLCTVAAKKLLNEKGIAAEKVGGGDTGNSDFGL